MMKIKIILFNQHWFHLCAVAEAVLYNKDHIESVELIFIRKGLMVWPLDAHFPSQFQSFSRLSPEYKLYEFLRDHLSDTSIEVKFTEPKISPTDKILDKDHKFNEFSQLRKLRYLSQPVGMAISSYLISKTRSSTPLLKKYQRLISDLYATYFQIQSYLSSVVSESNTDEVWLCNGRQLHERSVVEFCKSQQIRIKFFEIGGDGNALSRWILHDHSPHDRVKFQQEIETHWLNRRGNEFEELYKWFDEKLDPKLNPFTTNQIRNLDLGLTEKYLVFYTSSDDEVAAISEDWDSPWGNQVDAAKMLIDFFKKEEEIKLVIRVHPNILNKSKSDQLNWKGLVCNENVIIIPPESRIDSYSLLMHSEGVFTYGSTMGVEAVYRGLPLALLSRARYDVILENQYIDDKEKLSSWVSKTKSQSLPKPSRLGALMWANYFLTAGHPWKTVKVKTRGKRKVGYLGERKMRPNSVVILSSRLLNSLHSHLNLL
jgi:hypothetical protein